MDTNQVDNLLFRYQLVDMWQYITICDEVLPVNSDQELLEAQEALEHYGMESSPIWSLPASPDDGGLFCDAVKTNLRLFR